MKSSSFRGAAQGFALVSAAALLLLALETAAAATNKSQSSPSSTQKATTSTRGEPAANEGGAAAGADSSRAAAELKGAAPASPASQTSGGLKGADSHLGMESNIANAKVQLSPNDMTASAGHHHGKSHGKYYMYTEVPKKGAYKMGFKRGNHKHQIERKESVHKSHVHSYFKWHDKKGKGSHKFEFKHYDKKKKHHY